MFLNRRRVFTAFASKSQVSIFFLGANPAFFRHTVLRLRHWQRRPEQEGFVRFRLIADQVVGECRYALRMIVKTPGASAIAVASMALGIGANTAIFSLVNTLLLKLLPVKSPEQLYLVATNPQRLNTSWNYPDYRAMRDHNTVFDGACRLQPRHAAVRHTTDGANGRRFRALLRQFRLRQLFQRSRGDSRAGPLV